MDVPGSLPIASSAMPYRLMSWLAVYHIIALCFTLVTKAVEVPSIRSLLVRQVPTELYSAPGFPRLLLSSLANSTNDKNTLTM
ncbi:hypothetical protein K449DRAFT_148724 [Hypoxylon sp. EC38]|nr:hypothetical protein K449DRAFT_148724 [Hypoxylon sp. EC38]